MPVQLSPPSVILLDYNGNDEERYDHDESLNGIGQSNAAQTAHVLKKQDDNTDTNHRAVVVGIQTKDGVECGTNGRALSRQVNDAGKDLQRYGRVTQYLGTEPIGDEIGWRLLMIAHQTGLAKSSAGAKVSDADECCGGQPAK